MGMEPFGRGRRKGNECTNKTVHANSSWNRARSGKETLNCKSARSNGSSSQQQSALLGGKTEAQILNKFKINYLNEGLFADLNHD